MGPMLAPVAALVVWSIIMLLWMTATRLPALSKAGIKAAQAKPGGRGVDIEGVLPAQINWKAHNYTHLTETPTLFYAAAIVVALMGPTGADVAAGWAYVVLRVVHSLWQSLVNTIPVRLLLFTLSNLALLWLAARALQLTLFG